MIAQLQHDLPRPAAILHAYSRNSLELLTFNCIYIIVEFSFLSSPALILTHIQILNFVFHAPPCAERLPSKLMSVVVYLFSIAP